VRSWNVCKEQLSIKVDIPFMEAFIHLSIMNFSYGRREIDQAIIWAGLLVECFSWRYSFIYLVVCFFFLALFLLNSKQCNAFKTRALKVQEALQAAIPGLEVTFNPEKVSFLSDSHM
jgi:hypothetical protein